MGILVVNPKSPPLDDFSAGECSAEKPLGKGASSQDKLLAANDRKNGSVHSRARFPRFAGFAA